MQLFKKKRKNRNATQKKTNKLQRNLQVTNEAKHFDSKTKIHVNGRDQRERRKTITKQCLSCDFLFNVNDIVLFSSIANNLVFGNIQLRINSLWDWCNMRPEL